MAMQFKFDSNNHVGQVLKIDNTLTADGYENNHELRNNLRLIIDEIGKSSAIAQHLESPITSAQKLLNSDHVIYMMTEQNTPANFAVIGFLKMGWKKLFIYNKHDTCSETLVYCMLDFYIYESKQRQGYGKRLIEYMLQDIKLQPKHLVMDKPTTNLLQFMLKNFQLSKLVNQGNNFAVYEDFFDEFDENHDNTGNRTSGYNRPPTFGRHGAHKHHDSMGEIVQNTGPSSSVMYNHNNDFAHNQFNEVKPHTEEALGSLQINKYGDYVERDLKHHHSSNQYNEMKPHEEALGPLQINKYGDYVERDLKHHHSSNQFNEIKPHEDALGSLQINKFGDYVERDLKYHHSST